MTTARAILHRLLTGTWHGRRTGRRAGQRGLGQPGMERRLESARQRLKQTIPPPEQSGEESPVSKDRSQN